MDHFSLPCPTCQTKLKVRDLSIVGKILACPKCGGMVLVKAPPDWSEDSSSEHSTATATPNSSGSSIVVGPSTPVAISSFDDIDQLLDGAPAAPPPTKKPKRAPAAQNTNGQRKAPATQQPAAPTPAKSPAGNGKPTAPALPVAAPLPPNEATAGNAPENKQPAATTNAAAAGRSSTRLRTAAAIAPAAVPVVDANPVEAPAAEPATTPATSIAVVTTSPAASPPPTPLPLQADWAANRPWRTWLLVGASAITGIILATSVAVVAIRFLGPKEPDNVVQVEPESDPIVEPVPEVVDPPAPEPKPELDPTEAVASSDPLPKPEANLPPVPKPEPQPAPAEDPLGIADNPSESPAAKPEEKPAEPSKVFGSLDKFADLLNNNNSQPRDPAIDEEPPPTIPVDTTMPDKANDGPAVPAPRNIDLVARLADPMLEINADGVALYDFLQQMTELSTIPITLRPEGMQMTKRSPHSAIQLNKANTTVGQAISETITPLFLEMQTIDQQIVIKLSGTMREISVPLDDLAKGEPDGGQTIVDHITTMIAPGTWGDEPGQGQITLAKTDAKVKHHPLVLWQIIDFTERLREVRSLPIRSKQDAAIFRPVSRWKRTEAIRETTVSLNYSIPTSFTTIVDQLGRRAQVRILIDWQALTELGWTPDTETTLNADKASLESALDELTAPMELAWRVIDEKTLEISTPAALQTRTELELFPLPAQTDAAAAEQIIDRLQTDIGDTWFRESGGAGALRYDPAANCMISTLPQAQQREVERLLPGIVGS